jgi:hypothetical protein
MLENFHCCNGIKGLKNKNRFRAGTSFLIKKLFLQNLIKSMLYKITHNMIKTGINGTFNHFI